jgi:hypothetical protein
MISFWYVVACIFLPGLWGLFVATIYEILAARKRSREGRVLSQPEVFLDYEI